MINKDMIIADFIEQYPEKVHILREVGFHCIGCMLSVEATLAMGCLEAGIDVYDLIDKLNEDSSESTPISDGIKNYNETEE